jgi:putative flippase GtrA
MRHIITSQPLRFLLVGLLNTIFGYSIFAVLNILGLPYYLSILFATILGVLFNFKTIGKIVFKSRDNKLIFNFIIVYSFVYFLNIMGLKLVLPLKINLLMAQAILVLPLALVSYILNRTFVFKAS